MNIYGYFVARDLDCLKKVKCANFSTSTEAVQVNFDRVSHITLEDTSCEYVDLVAISSSAIITRPPRNLQQPSDRQH